ncbi:MAG: DUF421 domain-containing protein [Clostridia bacterium]|nr:DUF421 domain-containing protein [Clostridia bacterium]
MSFLGGFGMTVVLIRTFIIYFVVVAAVRLMGKRQIGQLQPTELVITLILSEIAASSVNDTDKPLVNSVIGVTVLVSLEIISSYLALKSGKFRRLAEGNAVYVIKEGKLDIRALEEIRFSIDDLMEALRQKDVFDISDVEYAVVETNGSLSVMLRADKIPLTLSTFGRKAEEKGLPVVVIADGRYIYSNFSICKTSKSRIDSILSDEKIHISHVMLMMLDKSGNRFIIPKEE